MHALAVAPPLLLLLAASCRPDGPASGGADSVRARAVAAAPDSGAMVRAVLLSELRRLADRSIFADSLPIHAQRVTFEDLPSAVVPGLVYHWAVYLPPEISHGYYRVVAARRAGRLEVLREPSDWGVVARGWRPADAAAAVRGCLELVNALTDRRPRAAPDRAAEDRTWADSLPALLSAGVRRRLARALRFAPDARHPSGYAAWEVTVWVAQASSTSTARRYRCTLPATPHAGPGVTTLAAVDSIKPGLLPFP